MLDTSLRFVFTSRVTCSRLAKDLNSTGAAKDAWRLQSGRRLELRPLARTAGDLLYPRLQMGGVIKRFVAQFHHGKSRRRSRTSFKPLGRNPGRTNRRHPLYSSGGVMISQFSGQPSHHSNVMLRQGLHVVSVVTADATGASSELARQKLNRCADSFCGWLEIQQHVGSACRSGRSSLPVAEQEHVDNLSMAVRESSLVQLLWHCWPFQRSCDPQRPCRSTGVLRTTFYLKCTRPQRDCVLARGG